jgi:formate dehydrogenase major subunit
VPGLGTSFGRGGATTFAMDMKHADSIMIMGSNMAECHPVAFRWVMQARTRPTNPATLIHVDPRFTRTSAMATMYAPLRAGSDIVFLGALINYMLQHHEPIFVKLEQEVETSLTDSPVRAAALAVSPLGLDPLGAAAALAAERGRAHAAAVATLPARERFFHDYLVRYTNAATLVTEDFKDTEADDLAGLFSGFDAEQRKYDFNKWRYETEPAGKEHKSEPEDKGKGYSFAMQVGKLVGPLPVQDPRLRHERCVFQVLRRHYKRYTPELVEQVCGTPREKLLEVAQALLENAGPDRTGAICYAVGWTQHTVGVQMIRAAAVLQALLGNIGRPGGGILALRGHATIQGCTDIATLYDIHPGYLNTPSALKQHDTLRDYIGTETSATSYWSNFPKFIVSQLKAWFGDDAQAENDYAYDYLPKLVGNHSHLPMFVEMSKGTIKGFFVMGQNPAVGGQNASFQRQALAKLDWMVVRDLYETETASFWKDSPEVKSGTLKPADIKTEVFFLPAAAVAEMEGSFTNTQRLVQWHDKAADPPGDARSDSWFTYHLGQRLKKAYARSKEARDRPIKALVWNYFDPKANDKWQIKDEPSAELILKEINGYQWKSGQDWEAKESPLVKAEALANFALLEDNGKTACGAWIYTSILTEPTAEDLERAKKAGKTPPRWHNHAANRHGDDWVALGWGFSWPANRRLMYNRASADPQGNPWPKEARLAGEFARAGGPRMRGYVYWDAGQKKWVGLDVPDFVLTKAPGTPAQPHGVGVAYHDGASPFIMKADGKAWLYVPKGLVDGPLPTFYEPYESPVKNLVYKQQSNPAALLWKVPGNPYAEVADPKYPHVLSTYRLTEHHLSGVMSRWLPWLAELQPELFCEISPEHAEEIGVQNTNVVEISTPRGKIHAKALVTRRIRPYRLKIMVKDKLEEKVVHHVGLPWHWGYKGLSRGDVVNNLSALVGDPNVTIHEAKVFVCQVRKA